MTIKAIKPLDKVSVVNPKRKVHKIEGVGKHVLSFGEKLMFKYYDEGVERNQSPPRYLPSVNFIEKNI